MSALTELFGRPELKGFPSAQELFNTIANEERRKGHHLIVLHLGPHALSCGRAPRDWSHPLLRLIQRELRALDLVDNGESPSVAFLRYALALISSFRSEIEREAFHVDCLIMNQRILEWNACESSCAE